MVGFLTGNRDRICYRSRQRRHDCNGEEIEIRRAGKAGARCVVGRLVRVCMSLIGGTRLQALALIHNRVLTKRLRAWIRRTFVKQCKESRIKAYWSTRERGDAIRAQSTNAVNSLFIPESMRPMLHHCNVTAPAVTLADITLWRPVLRDPSSLKRLIN